MHSLKPYTSIFVVLLLVSLVCGQSAMHSVATGSKLAYPVAHKGEVVDDYHGTKVADPYRWLEDLDSAETKAWVEAENKLTFDYLNQIPERAAIKTRLTTLWNFERYGVPGEDGGGYFLTKNGGL